MLYVLHILLHTCEMCLLFYQEEHYIYNAMQLSNDETENYLKPYTKLKKNLKTSSEVNFHNMYLRPAEKQFIISGQESRSPYKLITPNWVILMMSPLTTTLSQWSVSDNNRCRLLTSNEVRQLVHCSVRGSVLRVTRFHPSKYSV